MRRNQGDTGDPGPTGGDIGDQGEWQGANIFWEPNSPTERRTLKAWLNDVLPRAPQGEMSRKEYARHLFEIARCEGVQTTAKSIETRLIERQKS
jgi:hypothetical protein